MAADPALRSDTDGGKPKTGEASASQIIDRGMTGFSMLNFGIAGFGATNVDSGSIPTFRRMLRHPTIALARIARRAPIKAAGWTYTATREDPRAKRAIELIRSTFNPIRRRLCADMMSAEDFGFAPFEMVFDTQPVDGVMAWVISEFKLLLAERTRPMMDRDRNFIGVRNFAAEIERERVLWWTAGEEANNIWGIGANERALRVWRAWSETLNQSGKYIKIAAVPIPMATYPPGKSKDASGSTIENSTIAKKIVKKLQEENEGIVLPDMIAKYIEDGLITGKIDPSKVQAWRIDFLQPKVAAGQDLIDFMKYFDSMMARAWLIPERSILEGQFGTKAEAGEHASVAIAASQDLLTDFLECLNTGPVDQLLQFNFGPDAKGLVQIKAAPLDKAKLAIIQNMVTKVLTDTANVDLFLRVLKLDEMIDLLDLPVREDFDQDADPMTSGVLAEMRAAMVAAGLRSE